MVTHATITIEHNFTQNELWVAMLCIFGFFQKDMYTVTGIPVPQIKIIISTLCIVFNGCNSGNMACHALYKDFKEDGTYKGKDIFSDDMKRKILLIDPGIQFRFPPPSLN